MSRTAEDVMGRRLGTESPDENSPDGGEFFDDSAPNAPRPEQVFFDDPALDRMMGVVWALATEVYVLRDRLQSLEQTLSDSGAIDRAALDAEASPEEIRGNAADRDAFVAHLMDNLMGVQAAKGPLR